MVSAFLNSVPSTPYRQQVTNVSRQSTLPPSCSRARVESLRGPLDSWSGHSTKSYSVSACKTDISGSNVTSECDSSMTRAFHDWKSSKTQNPRLWIKLFLAFDHPPSLRCGKHCVFAWRASIGCRCRAPSAVDAEGVGRGTGAKLSARDSSHC